jgi:membrane-associated phospholipid phosphatase
MTAVAALGWSVLFGLSRVILGQHWLTDVMFGWPVGLAWLAVAITVHRLFLTVRRVGHEEPSGSGTPEALPVDARAMRRATSIMAPRERTIWVVPQGRAGLQ